MIGRVYQWLFDTHKHEWEIYKEQRYEKTDRYDNAVVAAGTLYTLRCKDCGMITSKKMSL